LLRKDDVIKYFYNFPDFAFTLNIAAKFWRQMSGRVFAVKKGRRPKMSFTDSKEK
jgi:hypothetical protein